MGYRSHAGRVEDLREGVGCAGQGKGMSMGLAAHEDAAHRELFTGDTVGIHLPSGDAVIGMDDDGAFQLSFGVTAGLIRPSKKFFFGQGRDGVSGHDGDDLASLVFDHSRGFDESGHRAGSSGVDGANDHVFSREQPRLGGEIMGLHEMRIGQGGNGDEAVDLTKRDARASESEFQRSSHQQGWACGELADGGHPRTYEDGRACAVWHVSLRSHGAIRAQRDTRGNGMNWG